MTVTFLHKKLKLNILRPTTYILNNVTLNVVLFPKSKHIINPIVFKKNIKLSRRSSIVVLP